MDTGVISAAFGALTQERRFEVIANNLANTGTAGFKRDRITFADLLHAPRPGVTSKPLAEAGGPALMPVGFGANWNASRVRVTDAVSDFAQGGLSDTGNPLDVAIEGNGFFKLQTPRGLRYTRRGSFTLAKDGTLTNQDGFPVLGQKGKKIVVPTDGQVVIGRDGAVSVAGQTVGTLELAQFPEGAALKKEGDSLYSAPGDPGPAKLPCSVRQGALEMSNVSAVGEMLDMMTAMRQYEAQQKVLKAYGEIDSHTNEIGQMR